MPSSSFRRCCFGAGLYSIMRLLRPVSHRRLASARRARGFDAPEASTRQCKNKRKKSQKSTYALIEREDEMFRFIV